jgi:four helix bundle protein
MFIALKVSLEVIKLLRSVVEELQQRDRDLADEVRRAATSAALNVAEGNKRAGKDRAHHFRIAAGSCAEVRAAIAVGQGWGHLEGVPLGDVEAALDRQAALLYRLAPRA